MSFVVAAGLILALAGIGVALLPIPPRLKHGISTVCFVAIVELLIWDYSSPHVWRIGRVVVGLVGAFVFLFWQSRWERGRQHGTLVRPAVDLSFLEPRADPTVPMTRHLGRTGTTHLPVTTAGTSVMAGSITSFAGSGTGTARPTALPDASFVFGQVVNHHAPGVSINGTHAGLTLTFFDLDDQLLLGPIEGRWRSSVAPFDLSPFRIHPDAGRIDIPADGNPREFDLAFKYLDDENAFAYNNTSYTADRAQRPEYRLTGVPPVWWTSDRLVGIVRLGGEDAPLCRRDRTSRGRIRRSFGVRLWSCIGVPGRR